MSYVSVERVVRRRPEIAWACLVDLAAMPRWVEGLVEVERLGAIASGAGMRVEVTMQNGEHRDLVTCEVSAWSEPRLLAIEARLKGSLVFHRAVLEPCEAGTRVRFEVEHNETGVFAEIFTRRHGLLGEPIEPESARFYERCVESFRRYVEASSEMAYR